MTRIIRVGVTFPPELLKDFDEVTAQMGYNNRSKAVQDAVRTFVSEKQALYKTKGEQAGIILMLYDHDVRGLENALTHTQHHYANVICSSMHIHLSEKECLEAVAVKGEAAEIRSLSSELSTRKGVKTVKPMLVSV
jgi:CopG family nickel-responsive transcriptional regulator